MDRNRPARELPAPVAPASAERWVINLRAAMAPLQDDMAVRERYKHLRVYHVARIEDGRHRYRLRLGFFATCAEAEAHVTALRTSYPAAFACAAERDDLRHAAGFAFAERPPSAPGELTPAATLAVLESRRTPAAPALQTVAPPLREAERGTQTLEGIELTLTDDAPATDSGLTAPVFAEARATSTRSTSGEPADWFAIELMACDQAPAHGSLPRLDIFAAYSVYSVTVADQPSVRHAIRLGFFRERVSADQVAAYVRNAFPDVRVVPVSQGERDRHVSVVASLGTPPGIAALEVPAPPSNVIELAINRAPASSSMPVARDRGSNGDSQPRAVSARAGNVRGRPAGGQGVDTARSGKHRTLGELLVEEARQTVLSESGIRRVPQSRRTLLGRLVERLKR